MYLEVETLEETKELSTYLHHYSSALEKLTTAMFLYHKGAEGLMRGVGGGGDLLSKATLIRQFSARLL